MADLMSIFGGPFVPPAKIEADPVEIQLRRSMEAAGLTPPTKIEIDGKMHRFNSGTKGKPGHDKPGWYIIFGDGVAAGRFGCWRSGIEVTWRADVGRELTVAEEMAHSRRLAEAKKLRDAETEKSREVAASTVETIWSGCIAADKAHPYLERKGIDAHGSRVTTDGRLVVPLYSDDGNLSSLQYIAHNGDKLYHPDGKTGGCFWMVGHMDEPGRLYIAEGFATAATIHEATGRPCIVAYSASNLVPVTGSLRERYGSGQELVIVADHDASGTGQKYADQASARYGALTIIPPEEGDANDYAMAGNSLKDLLEPTYDNWLIPADDFCSQPAPVKWLVKNWLQSNAFMMTHGPSGGGKTFVVLDWCLHMAAGLDNWHGHKVKQGAVVYLAGEGLHGLRSRVAAWKQHNKAGKLNMWLSRYGCDLNTPDGYRRVLESIRALGELPSLIVVDTLHRFLDGNENDPQDVKTMVDACGSLMREFDCSVMLVHHTGVSDETQHRARGSSAWRAAVEIEISVVPAKGNAPMQIIQRKAKDSEEAQPINAELSSVTIEGWLNEDGEPVTSAVIMPAEAAPEVKKESAIDRHRKLFENAWWASGAEDRDGYPYLSRSAFVDYIMSNGIVKSDASAKQYTKPSATDKPIGALILAEIICALEHGWRVTDPKNAAAMMMRRGTSGYQ